MMIVRIYAALLCLYPRQFRANFGEEMQAVFEEAITTQQDWKGEAYLFLRELCDLPGSLLNAYLSNWLQGGNISMHNEYISPSTKGQAFLGMLPFLAFGLSSMLSKVDDLFDFRTYYIYIAFYILALVGLLIGWIRDFPLWSYSSIGWTLVFAWWWTEMRTYGFDWGYRIWIPFGTTVLIALLWTRSLTPIKKILLESWNDWTRLSLAMYTFIAFMFLIYDENHHPYLLAFMFISTLATAAGAWFFLRSSNLKGRITSIFGGFVAIAVIGGISEATWDWRAYYGIAEMLVPCYLTILRIVISLSFITLILFWPALIGLIQRIVNHRAV